MRARDETSTVGSFLSNRRAVLHSSSSLPSPLPTARALALARRLEDAANSLFTSKDHQLKRKGHHANEAAEAAARAAAVKADESAEPALLWRCDQQELMTAPPCVVVLPAREQSPIPLPRKSTPQPQQCSSPTVDESFRETRPACDWPPAWAFMRTPEQDTCERSQESFPVEPLNPLVLDHDAILCSPRLRRAAAARAEVKTNNKADNLCAEDRFLCGGDVANEGELMPARTRAQQLISCFGSTTMKAESEAVSAISAFGSVKCGKEREGRVKDCDALPTVLSKAEVADNVHGAKLVGLDTDHLLISSNQESGGASSSGASTPVLKIVSDVCWVSEGCQDKANEDVLVELQVALAEAKLAVEHLRKSHRDELAHTISAHRKSLAMSMENQRAQQWLLAKAESARKSAYKQYAAQLEARDAEVFATRHRLGVERSRVQALEKAIMSAHKGSQRLRARLTNVQRGFGVLLCACIAFAMRVMFGPRGM